MKNVIEVQNVIIKTLVSAVPTKCYADFSKLSWWQDREKDGLII